VRDLAIDALRLGSGALLLALLLVAMHRTASDPTDGAVLGVAVQTMAGTVQECRSLSDTELAALPRHMRRQEICEPRAVPYRLEVRIDGESRLDRIYRPAGIHGDRPITVDRRIGLVAGSHSVRIRFAPDGSGGGHDLPVFTLEREVQFDERRIRVATLTDTTGSFEIR